MRWIIFLSCLMAVLEAFPEFPLTAKLPNIHWNASNPMFRIDNTDHIIDVNKGNMPFEYDQVNIICPVYTSGTKEEDVERYIIYNVSKEEYDSCRITNPASRIIAICDKPHKLMYFTITFRSFTPQPGGLEFRPGQDYYFISTSGGGDILTSDGGDTALYQKVGGRCATHNMRVIFKVCCGPTKAPSTLPPPPPSSTISTTAVTPIVTSSVFPVTKSTTTIYRIYHRPTNFPSYRPRPSVYTSRPPYKSYDFPREEGKMPSKKTEDRDKLPNETRAKNEELVKSQANAIQIQQNLMTVAILLSLVAYSRLCR